jgi:DNA processing protein
MVDGLIVVESAEQGGALITANLAAEYNRDVFALPGRISDTFSAGCNNLIAAQVASLINNADDVCRALNWPTSDQTEQQASPTLPIELNPEETLIVDFLENNEDASLQQIVVETGFPISKLMPLLIDLEFRGILLALPGGRYRKTAL